MELYTPTWINQDYGDGGVVDILVVDAYCGVEVLLAVLKTNRIICKRTYANYSSFHLRVFLGLLNPQG
jgi:hypothetical protein